MQPCCQHNKTNPNKQSASVWARRVGTVVLATTMLASQVYAQAVQGVDNPKTPSRGGGGFGLSLDLGAFIKTVQTLMEDERYSSPDATDLPQYETAQLIVSWPQSQHTQAMTLIKSSGSTSQTLAELTNLELSLAVLYFATNEQAQQALAKLQILTKKSPAIVVDRHAIAYPMADERAPVPGKQYARELLKAPVKPKLPGSVTVGIIDTEITNANTLALSQFKAKRIFPSTDKPATTDHGNAVAAIMAATGNGFEGFAQGVSLRAAGVMREVSPGVNATNTLMVAQALDWLASEKVQIVNLSLASAHDAVLANVINKSLKAGMVLVAAAGNGGAKASPAYPAAYAGVIAATAVDANKALYTRANRGSYIAIAAPGVDVWVPAVVNDGKSTKAKYMSGTSFASPFVSAAVAQSVAQQGKTTPPVQLQRLCSKAVKLETQTQDVGCGLLQM